MSDPSKAFLQTEKGKRIPCMFNPSEFEVSKANSWEGANNRAFEMPQQNFGGGQPATTSIELTFDSSIDGKPVTVHTTALADLMKIDSTLAGNAGASLKGRPPWVQFRWGKLSLFKGVVTNFSAKFTYFSVGGDALRATATIALTQFVDDVLFPKQNPTSGTPRTHRVHTVLAGERLDVLAHRYLGSSADWRSIADLNDLPDPFALPAGIGLKIPDPLDVSRA